MGYPVANQPSYLAAEQPPILTVFLFICRACMLSSVQPSLPFPSIPLSVCLSVCRTFLVYMTCKRKRDPTPTTVTRDKCLQACEFCIYIKQKNMSDIIFSSKLFYYTPYSHVLGMFTIYDKEYAAIIKIYFYEYFH